MPKKIYEIIKQVIDTILAIIGLFMCIPIFAIVSIIVKLDSKGKVIYTQERIRKKWEKI